nr:hypothetical protein [Angustibacter aerolatus]
MGGAVADRRDVLLPVVRLAQHRDGGSGDGGAAAAGPGGGVRVAAAGDRGDRRRGRKSGTS